MRREYISLAIDKKTKTIWFISKYLRLPGGSVPFTDVMQNNSANPGRGFSLLRSLVEQGYDCTLFVARHNYTPFKINKILPTELFFIDGVSVVFINVLAFRRTTSIARVLGWLQFEYRLLFIDVSNIPKPHYIVASSLSLLSVINGLIFRWKTKAKLVFEVRDIWPMVLTENAGYSRFNPFVMGMRLIEWLGYKYSNAIVATMPNLGEHVKEVLGYPRTVHCIPMGIPIELLNQTSVELPGDLVNSFPKNKFIVTYVGSIGIDNALDTLFEAARILKEESKIIFRVFGNGDLLEKYIESCSDLNNIEFGGAIPNDVVNAVLRNSSILYLATHPTVVLKYGQSLNKLIDYMYSGRPILASHSGFQSMINEAQCGYFVPAADVKRLCDEIVKLSRLPSNELSAIGEKGRSWVLANRTYEKLAADYIDVFKS
jgi:glycosyltransferase involved in cell wall biosynthesis